MINSKVVSKLVAITTMTLALGTAFAAQTQVGRFISVTQGASAAQSEPLQQSFMLNMPSTVNTIGDAVIYLLSNTSYKLVPSQHQTQSTKNLLQQALPLSDRTLGPMTVLQALSALSGGAYQVLLDPSHRYVSFVLRPRFQNLYLSH